MYNTLTEAPVFQVSTDRLTHKLSQGTLLVVERALVLMDLYEANMVCTAYGALASTACHA
jgi:hypothetical protein